VDIYYPAGARMDVRMPAVVLVMGWPNDLFIRKVGFKLKELSQYPFWASQIAAGGMAAVTYETDEPEQDIHRLLRFLSRQNGTLALDHRHLGLWSCSANVPTALHAMVARDQPYHRHLRCAAMYYPVVTFSPTAMHEVPAVLSVALSPDIPVQLVRVGRERPKIRESAMRILDKLRADRVPFECIRVPQSVHGFDIVQGDLATRQVIARTVAFLSEHVLHPSPVPRTEDGSRPTKDGGRRKDVFRAPGIVPSW
jgi:hypothetical protein